MAEIMKKLGIEKKSELQNNFDTIYDKYKDKALASGITGDLKFVIDGNFVVVYVIFKK